MQQLNKEQFNEFQLAVKNGVDPSLLTPGYNAGQMREKRLAIENRLDPSLFTTDISAEKMHSMRILMQMGMEINNDFVHAYDENQLREIQLGEKYGLNTSVYQHSFLSASQMKSMRLKLLSEKVVQYIRHQAVNILSKLEEKISPEKSIEQSRDAQLEAAVLNVLKELELSDSATLEQVAEQVSKAVDDRESIQLSEDDLLVDAETVKTAGEYEVLDTYIYTDDISFALLRDKSNQYLIAHKYKEDDLHNASWDDEVHYDNVISAATDYKELIQEADSVKEKINEATKSFSFNETEYIVLGVDDMYDDAYRLNMLKTNAKDIRDQYLQVVAVLDSNPTIKNLADQILKNRVHERIAQNEEVVKAEEPEALKTEASKTVNQTVNHEKNAESDALDKQYLARAQSKDTKSAALDYIANNSNDEEVLCAVLNNPNCPNAVMHLLLQHDNEKVKSVASAALETREKTNNLEEIVIDKSNVIREFPTKNEKDRTGKPMMLSIIALPERNSIGLGATMVIPSYFVQPIKDNPEQVKVQINPSRTFDIRANDISVIKDGKTIIKEFNKEKTKSLDKRLAKATEKKAKAPRKTKSKEKEKTKDDIQK